MRRSSLIEEARAAEPEPVEVVERVVGVQQLGLEVERALLPALPEVPPRQEAEPNCIKIGLPGKSILGDYFQESRTS